MKENICTIPINDLFKPKDGCPVCRMTEMLEENYVDFIVGDAMMEPNIRIETNAKGFCHRHFSKMFTAGQKLPNALILESHLKSVIENVLPQKPSGKPDKKALEKIESLNKTCYVCERIDTDIHHLLATVFAEYQKSEEFRSLYREQPFICLNHYALIMRDAVGKRGVGSKYIKDFHKDTYELAKKQLETLKEQTTYFCSMFDYRNRGKDFGDSKDVIERDIEFLTGEKP
ncbi:MAG: DUF6062 family protein [Ruminococcus sp.]|nr:DUF6062 family protein [Ruminococcus sp.]